MTTIPEGILVGYGNPLLDITIVTGNEFLEKYDLKANDAILAEPKQSGMFEDMVKNYNPEYVAGGATQNSIRIAQWLLQAKNATTFFGCVGNDEMADILRKKGSEVGCNVRYQVSSTQKTGVCGAVITGHDRSLVTELNAAEHFTPDYLKEPENLALIEKARFFYVGGFPFSASPPSVKLLAEHACDTNKTLIMNLSAPFLCSFFVDPDIGIMQYVDILFGNDDEAATFCKLAGIAATDLKEMAVGITKLPKKNTSRARSVIITRGPNPTIVAQDGKVFEWPIDAAPKDLIKDTNGCGDSFVGGFLSQLVQGKPLEECLRCGNYAAKVVIQHFGCTYPAKPDFK